MARRSHRTATASWNYRLDLSDRTAQFHHIDRDLKVIGRGKMLLT
jgi:hypothetical protein